MSGLGNVGAGHTLGRYQLLVPIALGGMATVWAARTTGSFRKIVAVKLMRNELSDDDDFEQMFLDEASLISQIRHPNVVEILDLGEEDRALYQVMEWVDGEPLNVVLREARNQGGIPLPILLRVIKQVCAGLHAAHELRSPDGTLAGLVHRDVSPQNILIGYDGMVKVVDFGVAKAALNKQTTRIGSLKGRAPYMAPEQLRGDPIDRRTDIFALGIILYQVLTGKHPFQGDTDFEIMRRITSGGPPTPPRSIVPTMSPDIEAVVLRALAPAPDDRFSTMLEVLRALERVTPPDAQIGAEDVAAYMRRLVGPRGEQRRAAIREAEQLAQGDQAPTSRLPSLSANRPTQNPLPVAPSGASSPELAAIVQAAAAAAEGRSVSLSQPKLSQPNRYPSAPPAVPVHRPASAPPPASMGRFPDFRRAPWAIRARQANRAQLVLFGGIALVLILVVIALLAMTNTNPGG
ncbi:serine/threonine-protein kinase [Chondromyces apiculatus]|uniref:Serine/threonine-protein kinase n=1 Tax=Chondromyces apiculatus DSM 436 TaxID=1192034 RepID=A0A017SYW0_9BACT|nr:serine/threonine-protein kinase [Chondromyces apiculatus]EYF02128.1 Serine/threonine-protein kinase [Chondromyces apiculatus DSM 436]